mmetsp:Transcript_84565/g.234487  ORF Transcript_84565/g.234487 Transcript_84565/m.234487 type:complete len:339 (-) Transcript_84565:1411-2427(-)
MPIGRPHRTLLRASSALSALSTVSRPCPSWATARCRRSTPATSTCASSSTLRSPGARARTASAIRNGSSRRTTRGAALASRHLPRGRGCTWRAPWSSSLTSTAGRSRSSTAATPSRRSTRCTRHPISTRFPRRQLPMTSGPSSRSTPTFTRTLWPTRTRATCPTAMPRPPSAASRGTVAPSSASRMNSRTCRKARENHSCRASASRMTCCSSPWRVTPLVTTSTARSRPWMLGQATCTSCPTFRWASSRWPSASPRAIPTTSPWASRSMAWVPAAPAGVCGWGRKTQVPRTSSTAMAWASTPVGFTSSLPTTARLIWPPSWAGRRAARLLLSRPRPAI